MVAARGVGRLCLIALGVALAGDVRADVPAKKSLFDPARHMRVSEVKPGMTGHGLSVFSGTRIERFNVEVISVLKNFNPKYDVILIRCSGANLEHTGAIGGMSGSPVYLTDPTGRSRLVGAFAYGWPLLKDPLAGVQPIEYMLAIPDPTPSVATTLPGGGAGGRVPGSAAARPRGNMSWNVADALLGSNEHVPATPPEPDLDARSDVQLRPLVTPLMSAGIPAGTLQRFARRLADKGMVPLQAGASGAGDDSTPPAALEPGAVLAAPMVQGDVELTAVGTVTEVIGERVFGFGHPFNNDGPISLPMGVGQVNGILPSLNQSLKLGSLQQVRGALVADQSVGVMGRLGAEAQSAPVELRVMYGDGSQDETYRFEFAMHPRLTPMLVSMVLGSALTSRRDLPQYHTLDYDMTIEFSGGQNVRVRDRAVNTSPDAWAMQSVMFPVQVAMHDNPFERVPISRVSGTVRVTPEAREAEILHVNLPRKKYKPGEVVKAFVTYRPFRAPEAVLPIELALPAEIADGSYQLVIADWTRHVTDERAAQPFRFTAESIDDVFTVLRDVMSLRHDALYVRLNRAADGVALGRVAMPRLPSSRRHVLLSAGRSNTTPFVSSTVKVLPTDLVMKGSAEFTVEIDSQRRVETAGASKLRPSEVTPAVPAQEDK